jgi:hypothetical protein
MKTILFSGFAATALLFAGSGAEAGDSSHKTRSAAHSGEDAYFDQPDYGPSMRADAQAYDWGDNGSTAFAAPDGARYSYDGEWTGKYVDPQGNVFEGEWQGTVTRRGDGPGHSAGPPPHHAQAGAPYSSDLADDAEPENYAVPRGYEGYEQCLKSNGLKGAAIGAILGGVAGNRIAGRGDRLGGTLLGAGLGGLAGAAIEKATDKCKRYKPRHMAYPPQGYPQGYPQGGYYYSQAPIVNVTVVPGASHSTTTVTEEVFYETVKTYPRKKAVRKWKPRPKARCLCR